MFCNFVVSLCEIIERGDWQRNHWKQTNERGGVRWTKAIPFISRKMNYNIGHGLVGRVAAIASDQRFRILKKKIENGTSGVQFSHAKAIVPVFYLLTRIQTSTV
jgi:hypothetical protein